MPFKSIEERKAYNKTYYMSNKIKLICEHNIIKQNCKECHGSSICIHNRKKTQCKECKGSSFCEHNIIKYTCKECKGSHICLHDKLKIQCKECKGSSFCKHNITKTTCKECKGTRICLHNKQKTQCKECNFSLYLISLQRNTMNRIIKHSNALKSKHTIEYLGCDIEYFIKFITSKMTLDMSWDNIQLDHIKPISIFNLDIHTDFLDCCHYSNYQPLVSVDNLKKSNKWNDIDETFWLENIKGKEYLHIYKPI